MGIYIYQFTLFLSPVKASERGHLGWKPNSHGTDFNCRLPNQVRFSFQDNVLHVNLVTRHSEWSIINNKKKKSRELLDITNFLHCQDIVPIAIDDTATHDTAQVQEEKITICNLTLWTWWMAEKGNPAFWFVHISQTDDCWYKQKTISSCQYLKHGSYQGSIKEGEEENNKEQRITFLKKTTTTLKKCFRLPEV